MTEHIIVEEFHEPKKSREFIQQAPPMSANMPTEPQHTEHLYTESNYHTASRVPQNGYYEGGNNYTDLSNANPTPNQSVIMHNQYMPAPAPSEYSMVFPPSSNAHEQSAPQGYPPLQPVRFNPMYRRQESPAPNYNPNNYNIMQY